MEKKKKSSPNEMILQYISKNLNEVRIFGDKFVKNNKKNCSIYIKDKKHDLVSVLNIKDDYRSGDYLIIKIKLDKIKNMSYMFYACTELKSIVEITDYTKDHINNMSSMFYGCTFLEDLSNLGKLNTKNVQDISSLFFGCSSLKKLPDISNWKIDKVIDMKNMFYGCSSLFSLPDISIWNTKNVIDMNSLFFGCSLL